MIMEPAEVEVHPVTADRWDELVEFFERKGPRGGIPMPGSCWCRAWHEESDQPRPVRKAAMKADVDASRTVGLLGYVDGPAIGWVAVSPRSDQPRLERSRHYGPEPGDADVFAITCFYVQLEARGSGIASALLDAAIDYARRLGASAVDVFPKAGDAPHISSSRRAEENYHWMGRRSWYDARGFTVIRDPGKRLVMRLPLR
ncbi:GNAT family N-acetyltransferase [Microlunatus parietis]|uniref:GNAT superfamily N-acetyltransferase n=1 Tax=Microlunatus parietis TaxID=682979 RepID=A0A7Y9IA41_9ACTN|nr:GNAT family N-acetyltransferase [Microlunatus parietis]NYE73070.1 GNAT superfamily N-acetyltransferase [Microlunatus parietis]